MEKKIAVPSDDGINIAGHFGRSACFVVFATEEGRVTGKEVRPNSAGGAHHGECHGGAHEHGHGHNHDAMGQALQDCDAILCRGMGLRAAQALKSFGVEPLMVNTELPAQEAVEAYLAGRLAVGESFCRCHH